MGRLIVWGAGALGGRVAKAWVANGGEALGFTLSKDRHKALKAAGVTPIVGEPIKHLTPDDHLLLSLPGSAKQTIGISRLRHLPAPKRLVVIGSVGYYGIRHGTVSEETPSGSEDRCIKSAGLEAAVRDWVPEATILRMAGLYQKGRGPLSALRRRGAPLMGPPDTTLSLMHYDDAATATFEALRRPEVKRVYTCVVKPCPTRQAFYTAACVLLDLPLPSFSRALKKAPADYDVSLMSSDLLPTAEHPRWQEALVP